VQCKKRMEYLNRNCPKYFPEQEHVPGYCWIPEYKTSKGTPFEIFEVQSSECPKSVTSPLTKELLLQGSRQKNAQEMGISLYPAGEIEARLLDAFMIMERENARIREAERGAIGVES
jgi:hypothetical protein